MSRKYITLNKARGTKNKTGDWRNDYDWTDKNDHPVSTSEIKPGSNVLVDFQHKGNFDEKGQVIKKLRKNLLVRIPHRDCSIDLKGQYHSDRFPGRYSIPQSRLKIISKGDTK
tara:strand:- start:29 stop:367 length:339 start_codon:yes stop_codon:yes gene_type:complete